MKTEEYLKWYEDLISRFQGIPRRQITNYSVPTFCYDRQEAAAWTAEAGSALAAVFPLTHECRRSWDRLVLGLMPGSPHGGTLEETLGVFKGAARQIKDGRLGSILDAVRAETEDELLEQAIALLRADYLAAAAVIAGGALEAHLKHLALKNGLTIAGDGSISKYDVAIAQARNATGTSAYLATDSKLVRGWGGIRNDAAHDPGAFARSQDELHRMIEGIREFISRTS